MRLYNIQHVIEWVHGISCFMEILFLFWCTAGREMSELRHVINELRDFDSLVSDGFIFWIFKKYR